jgi:hypothetical protein
VLFRQAAEQGDAAAMNALGNLYANGDAGLTKDAGTAIDYYQRAGQAGYSTSYYNLAKLYKDDQLVPQDFSKSARYSETGATLGNANCKNLLAYYYFKGFGVQQNYARAFNLYRELAQSGDANAQYFLGLCYRNGYGTTANLAEAKRWLQTASQNGEGQARHELSAEPKPENSNLHNPGLQLQVDKLKNYQENVIASENNNISGTYQGFAVYYDFSGRFVHNVVPLTLTLSKTTDGYTGIWKEEGNDVAVKGSFRSNNFAFDGSSQYTRRNYYSYRDEERYQFKAAKLSVKYIQDSFYLTGDMQFYSLDRKEPGQPMYITLGRKITDGETGTGNFKLAVTPNPAVAEIRATFTVTNTCKVSFNIVDMNGRTIATQNNQPLLPPGTYTVPVRVQHLANGNYTLRMTTSTGAVLNKQFIKH